jgi:hypothetical protein
MKKKKKKQVSRYRRLFILKRGREGRKSEKRRQPII